MPEEQLFKTESTRTRSEIAQLLEATAKQIESGSVELESDDQHQTVELPEHPVLEVELERQTDAETGEMLFELEFELSWSE